MFTGAAGYPCGGISWSKYNCTDTVGDGIGDTPYPIDFTNEDRYPLGFFNTPHIPIIFGPTNGEAGKIYNYSILTIDPNNDDVYFYIDWGDGVFDEWIGPYSSGNEIIISHTWNVRGIYTIRVKAKDIHNFESGWGTLGIEMPLSFSSTFSSKSFIINRILGLLYGSNKIIFQ